MKAFQLLSVFAILIPTIGKLLAPHYCDLTITDIRQDCSNSILMVTVKNQGEVSSVASILAVRPIEETENCLKTTEVPIYGLKPGREVTVKVYLRNEYPNCRCSSTVAGARGSTRKIMFFADDTATNTESDETNNQMGYGYSGLDL
jgi:hypothetical protein